MSRNSSNRHTLYQNKFDKTSTTHAKEYLMASSYQKINTRPYGYLPSPP